MASGLSGRANSGSKGFDFASDDILCSYEDYNSNQDSSNGGQSSDPAVGINSSKDFHKSRMTRSSVFPTSYSQPEDSFNQDVSSIVEKSMKKYADNLMRFLEGISSRLSQLELYCYNVDKSIGEMRSDLARDHDGADLKLKSLDRHLQEVHRSVQILRDKQELAETQKELSKLQLVQKESSSPSQSQFNEDKSSPPASDAKKSENSPEMHNQQLALALPHQVAPQQQQQPAVLPSQPAPQNVIQQQPYYLTSNQLPTPAPQTQHSQSQYSDPQYRTPPMQEMSRVPQPAQAQVNQTPPVQSFPQYQQQWPQQVPQQVPPPQQPSIQPQVGPQSSTVYHPYPTGQSTNASPETLPSSMSMQVPFSSVPQPVSSRADAMPYGYTGGAGRTGPQQPTQQGKVTFGAQTGDGYAVAGPHQGLRPPGSPYMMYDSEGARPHHQPQQPHFPQGGYPPTNLSLQNPQPSAAAMVRNPNHSQFVRNHPYNELVEKLVSMGCRGDHVVSVIQRMEESGQPVDFNSVLDRLNVHSSGGSQSQRGW